MSARGSIKLHPFGTSSGGTGAKVVKFYFPSSTYQAIVLLVCTLFYYLTIEQFLIHVPSEVRHTCGKGCIKNYSIV